MITFTVPDTATSCFVVATDRVPEELPISALQDLPDAFAEGASERLGTPSLAITSYPAADSPWDLSHTFGGTAEVSDAREAVHHIGVTAALPVNDQPVGIQIARAAARAIADQLRGTAVDLDTGQILSNDAENTRFLLADDWLGVWLPPYRNGGRCTSPDDEVDACECVNLTTSGLTRFGLPELQITQVACHHDLAALNVLRVTAQRLLPTGRQPGGHSFSRDLSITGADFSAFWGVHHPMWDDGPVPVHLTPRGGSLVSIGPPKAFPGTLNEWLWDELPPVLYDLLSCEPDP
ncbi:hypothetical protein [Spirillospora sp. CA-294931]|uniref:hypothetical protein n=1 Tax=Spirillospora sp. CA-294931 TaxID=3240042 RepID=UPI003D947F24